jgi:hypothetical protein
VEAGRTNTVGVVVVVVVVGAVVVGAVAAEID